MTEQALRPRLVIVKDDDPPRWVVEALDLLARADNGDLGAARALLDGLNRAEQP